MSKYRDFLSSLDSSNVDRQNNYGGTYECQVCGEIVLGAYNDPAKEKLSWTCSHGHSSSIRWTA